MILSRIKAAYYSVEFVISVLLVVFFMWLFSKHIHAVRRIWAKTQRFFGFYKLEVIGEPDLNADIILINHQSMLDIVVLEEIYPKNLCWIAKAQIGKIPIIGKILSLPKMIAVERESKHSLVKLLKDAKERVEDGRVLAIFPEGTRSQTRELLPFKGGAKMIVEKLNLKAQPVVVVGSDILDVKNFKFSSGAIKVIYLPQIDTSDKEWLENTRAAMQATLDSQRGD